ncbi:oligoendopeptidase F [Rhodospirillales bacterium TMPK1]|uniref:Oligopeptidase F n=2 Tax=Roseiterribacter gracilis TaxID=2812848 RepID=A0A8S8XKJ0_9PROT|nr:oligoendopeptidase F [Rhodospirillales bacterium TMPK1]
MWDLTQLYPDDAAWDAERLAVKSALPGVKPFKGTLGTDAATLLRAMDTTSALTKRLGRLNTYASLKADENLKNTKPQEMRQLMQALSSEYGQAVSWMRPEIAALGKDKLEEFIKAEPGLAKHAFGLRDIQRLAAHVLSDEAESILAGTSVVRAGPNAIYSQLSNAELPWPTVTLATGKTIRLDSQGYTEARQATNRDDRKRVFDAFFGAWNQYHNTIGQMYVSSVRGDVFGARSRKYPTALAASLAANDVPDDVYKSLVKSANDGLPTLHRYFKLRQRLLGLKEIRYYDIYPPMLKSDRKFPIERTRELTLAAMQPLGPDYVAKITKATGERWANIYPTEGKRAGAYMNPGAYDVHPYLLLNHHDTYDGLSTYAHEWGHAMHSVLANEAQPYENAGYPLFLAEIASTCNEMLLADRMVADAKTKDDKLFYLGQILESLRGTFFRQTMFAEFELKTHEAIERGEALSGDKLSAIYLDLLKRYHGDREGVMKIDDLYGVEWAFIPHFYRAYYVYQYATSISAAAWFAEQIQTKGDAGRDNYLAVLKAGGSDHPVAILQKAGLDMTKPEPYQALVRRMDRIMDEMEKLLAEKN